MSWLSRLFGEQVPEEIRGGLAEGEHVLASGAVATGGHVAVTALGLWVPEGAGARRIGWHLISKAVWSGDTLAVTEAQVTAHAGKAVLLADRAPVRYVLPKPGRIPVMVRRRVEGSIRSRHRKDLPGEGGAWFVARKLPGTDGVVLQVRPDPGTDTGPLAAIAEEAAEQLAGP
ncbi:hypothetical protein [Qaidamihabitans albus]|uniref:hypothetical protein n=1 Tax=Qaidamihabitans albus TaxID=2795733 RepID=UPI0018F17BAA|nr:hypothetical protein [Qaidamihabitans albus]